MLRIRIHQNHKIIGKPCVLQVSVGPPTGGLLSPFQHPVNLIQVQVAEHGREHPTLGKALRTGCFDQQFQQMHDLRVIDPPRDFLEQDVMSHVVEKGTQINIKNPSLPVHNRLRDPCHRVMRRPLRPVAIRPRLKIGLEDGLKDELERALNRTVPDSGNRQHADAFASGFGYLHSS